MRVFRRTMGEEIWKVVAIAPFVLVLGATIPKAFGLVEGFPFNKVVEHAPPQLRAIAEYLFSDLVKFNGFLVARWFEGHLLILGVVLATLLGMGAIAGEVGQGTMEFLLAQPVSRTRVVVEKFVALNACLFTGLVVAFWSLLWGVHRAGHTVALSRVLLAHVRLFALLFSVLSYTFFCSTLARRTGTAAAGSMVLTAYAAVTTILAGIYNHSWFVLKLQRTSVLFYAQQKPLMLRGHMDWWHVVVLFGVGIAFFAASIIAFRRRQL
jgi:ABC-2 type transport system permease protein